MRSINRCHSIVPRPSPPSGRGATVAGPSIAALALLLANGAGSAAQSRPFLRSRASTRSASFPAGDPGEQAAGDKAGVRGNAGKGRPAASYGFNDARYAVIATISSSLSFDAGSFISAAPGPLRAPSLKSMSCRAIALGERPAMPGTSPRP